MTACRLLLIGILSGAAMGVPALAQTSSLGARERAETARQAPGIPPREVPRVSRNAVYENHSWISVPPRLPKTFKPGDLITVVVRESRKFQADAELNTRKEFDVESQLDEFLKFTDGGVGASRFSRGKPNIDYRFLNELEGDADTKRQDKLTTRITARIIDVKPNGLLVLEATARMQHDDEISVMTLTGTCRKEDVTADNSVLSTQVADKAISVRNEGALRATSSRGWIPKLLDWLKPF